MCMGPYISLKSAALRFPRAFFPLLKGSVYQSDDMPREKCFNRIGYFVRMNAGKSVLRIITTLFIVHKAELEWKYCS